MTTSTFSDIALDGGDLSDSDNLLTGMDAVMQRISLALLMHQGEWFADPTAGLPWTTWSRTKSLPLTIVEGQVRDVLADLPPVTAVRSVSAARDVEARSISITTELDIGRATVEAVFAPQATEQHGNLSPYVHYRILG